MGFSNNIYISGSISKNENYKEDFARAKRFLMKAYEPFGCRVFSPAELSDILGDVDWNVYMAIDFKFLELCDTVYMLEGWRSSVGARAEHEIAKREGKHIIYGKREDYYSENG